MILNVPPLIVRSCAAWIPSLPVLIVMLPPVIVMLPVAPSVASTASGSERIPSSAELTVMSPDSIESVLSEEMPCFADVTLRVKSLMVSAPYSPTFIAFLELQFKLMYRRHRL